MKDEIIIICDDSKFMEPHPPLTVEEQSKRRNFWEKMEERYLKNAKPFVVSY